MSAVATLLVAVPAAPVQASCSQPIDQITAIRRADSVFVGRVIELADFNRMATMQVIEIWKGSDLDELVTVSGSTSGAPQVRVTDRTYTLRSTYLVVPFGSRSPFSDDACSATGLFVPLGGQIPPRFQDAVGATTARFPITAAPATGTSESSGGFGQQLLVGGSIVMLALVVLVRRRRKKSATPEISRRAAPARSIAGCVPESAWRSGPSARQSGCSRGRGRKAQAAAAAAEALFAIWRGSEAGSPLQVGTRQPGDPAKEGASRQG